MMNHPPGKAAKGTGESRVISARLNPEYETERAALEVVDRLLEQGYSKREILTDALLRAAGYTPEMFHRTRVDNTLVALEEQMAGLDLRDLRDKIDALYEMVAHQIVDVLRTLRNEDPESLRRFANSNDDDDGGIELDPQFVRNAKRAVRKTYQQRLREKDE